MIGKQILAAVSLNKELMKDIPAVIAQDEEELQTISSELGRILEANVHRLSNGLVVIASTGN